MRVIRFAGACFAVFLACSSKKPIGFGDSGMDDSGDMLDDSGDLQTGEAGDADWCIPDVGNFDIPGNNCDDDGDGLVDNAPACDDGTLPETGDPWQFAKSLPLCQKASSPNDARWGVITATYTQGDMMMTPPKAEQHGIEKKYGNVIKPREGKSMGMLSSGWAREYDNCNGPMGFMKGGCPMTGMGTVPMGYPKPAMGCTVSNVTNDVIVEKLKIKVPKNAKGFTFDFNFFSGEWPEWVCTTFNDSFIAYYQSKAFNMGMAENISFDVMKNPVSVNNGFFDRCSPQPANVACLSPMPKSVPCKGGDMELQGTGFYDPGSHCGGQQDSGGGYRMAHHFRARRSRRNDRARFLCLRRRRSSVRLGRSP